jgi:hypothetical protein
VLSENQAFIGIINVLPRIDGAAPKLFFEKYALG